MKWMLSDGNILLKQEPHNLKDVEFIKQYKPYKINDRGDYKIPLTKKSLTDFINHYQIDIINNPLLLSTMFHLDLSLNFNLFETQTILNNMLRTYQQQGVNWINYRLQHTKALGLFWAMRTGKTRTTTIATKDYKKIIVLSLSGQEKNWVDTYNYTTNRQCINLHKRTPRERDVIYNNYNQSSSAILVGSINTITNDILTKKFIPKDIDMLIVDEIHKAKNYKTNLYKGVRELRKICKLCLGLTGTPVSKHINEMLPLFSLLLPDRFNKTYLSQYFFNQEYNEWSGYGVAGDLRKDKEQEWFEFVALYFSQVKKEQALVWAKEPVKEVVKLYMSAKQRKVYEDCLYHFEIKQSENETQQLQEVIAQFTRLKQIGTHPLLVGVDAPSVKEDWLMEYLEVDEPRDGIIIFTTHTSYLKMLYEKLKDKYRVCLITGETKDKTKVANDFQDGKYDIVLANIQAGSKGITLDRADTMIFLDEDWRPDENQQAIERFTPTSEDKVKFRQVIRLEISDEFENGILSMDKYINMVVENKITQTELINNFKEHFKKLFTN